MPWTISSPPTSFKNFVGKKLAKAVSIANAVLKQCVADGGTDKECAGRAIAIAASKVKELSMKDEARVLAEPTRLSEIVRNFVDGVRGTSVAIDIVHDPDRGAAAWIEELEIADSSTKAGKQALWATIRWTEPGAELVQKEVYRYISAEFGAHTDPETKAKINNVLFAATLTNRPFLKGMAPVALDEDGNLPTTIEILREGDYYHPQYGDIAIKAEEDSESAIDRIVNGVLKILGKEVPQRGFAETKTIGEVTMDEKILEILKANGIELEADADQYVALEQLIDSLKAEPDENEETTLEAEETATKLEETANENVRLAEKNIKLEERVKALEKASYDANKQVFFDEAIRQGTMRPADRDKYEALYDASPEGVKALFEDAVPVVDFEVHGSDENAETLSEDERELEKVKAFAAENKVPLHEAYGAILAQGG